MKKNLPNVFQSPINKSINNNKDYYYDRNIKNEINDEENVLKKINEIFASSTHVYKSKVEITTDRGIDTVFIVGKSGNYLLTLDGKKININEIRKVKKI